MTQIAKPDDEGKHEPRVIYAVPEICGVNVYADEFGDITLVHSGIYGPVISFPAQYAPNVAEAILEIADELLAQGEQVEETADQEPAQLDLETTIAKVGAPQKEGKKVGLSVKAGGAE